MAERQKVVKEPVWPVVWRVFAFCGPLRGWFSLAVVFDLTMAGLLILNNDLIRRMFDAVGTGNTSGFWHFVWLLVGLSVLGIPLGTLRTASLGRFYEGGLARLRSAIAARGARLPVAYLEQRHSGDLLSVLNADLTKLKTLLQSNLFDLVGQPVRLVAALAYMLWINWLLTVVAVVFTPVIFIVISALTAPIAKRSEEMQTEIGQVNSVAQDSLSGAMVVRAFNLAGLLDQRFHSTNQQALKKGLSISRWQALPEGLIMPMAITPFILAVGLGGYLIIHQQMTFGGMFAFINLLNFVVNPLASLPAVFSQVGEAAGAARRVFELLDQQPERSDGLFTQPDDSRAPVVVFRGVNFAYADGGEAVLKDVTFDIPAGKTVAIVGPSGGGKSTLIKLILGYYPLPDGQVALFGRDLNQWQLSAAREQMAFVAQDTYLFPVSIGENIRLGKPGATQAEVERSARQANIHDFISSLPQGYDTPAGEWGGRLSGGQKQRISLARAILKDAPILLLDEPTSALDTESEALVQQALDRFSAGRTTIVIAHRLSTIKNADHILVLENGTIVEQGTNEALIAHGGTYLDLYRRQFAQEPAGPPVTGAPRSSASRTAHGNASSTPATVTAGEGD